jgi:hypothetical protein
MLSERMLLWLLISIDMALGHDTMQGLHLSESRHTALLGAAEWQMFEGREVQILKPGCLDNIQGNVI